MSANNNPGANIPNSQLADPDPLLKCQTLLPILKESVTNLITHTVYILQSTNIGQCSQTDIQMLNKCVEDFNNISDQIHHWLNLADTTVAHYLIGRKFSNEVTSTFNMPPANASADNSSAKNILFYPEYMCNAKRQVKATQALRSLLVDFADGLETNPNLS